MVKKSGEKPPIPTNLFFAITAGADILGSTMNIYGLTYLNSSIYQVMRTLELVAICILNKIILKNPIYIHNILGIFFIMFGIFIFGISEWYVEEKYIREPLRALFGILLLCISQFFTSLAYIFQEMFIKKYNVHPSQLVGFEGLWGLLPYTILLIIFQFISCDNWSKHLKEGICSQNEDGHFHMEDSKYAFTQMKGKPGMLIIYIFYIISTCFYNIVGINLTKLVSSTARVVVDSIRSFFIWLFFLFYPNENIKEEFNFVQIFGFCFLIIGNLIYNEIIVLHFCELDYFTRDNIFKRKKEEEKDKMIVKNENEKLYLTVDGEDFSGCEEKK